MAPGPCWRRAVLLLVAMLVGGSLARAQMTLLVEDPFGQFGAFNPTGHAAIYLRRVCAETPTRLRMCRPGEMGVVVSRYHHIGGYDWLAIPVLPYLYAVDHVSDVPGTVTPVEVDALRDAYRRRWLESVAPDGPEGETPDGEWVQLVGAAYDREIHGFQLASTVEQDRKVVRWFNARRNRSHFNLFFNNCADLARNVIGMYYPHTVRRSFLADFGFTTPKHLAMMLTRYGTKHPDAEMWAFVISQVPGTMERSRTIRGVSESLLESKKYVLPLLYFFPEFTGGMAVAYITRGRYTMPADADRLRPADFGMQAPEVERGELREGLAQTATDLGAPDSVAPGRVVPGRVAPF